MSTDPESPANSNEPNETNITTTTKVSKTQFAYTLITLISVTILVISFFAYHIYMAIASLNEWFDDIKDYSISGILQSIVYIFIWVLLTVVIVFIIFYCVNLVANTYTDYLASKNVVDEIPLGYMNRTRRDITNTHSNRRRAVIVTSDNEDEQPRGNSVDTLPLYQEYEGNELESTEFDDTRTIDFPQYPPPPAYHPHGD